jgi:hypothetical protein
LHDQSAGLQHATAICDRERHMGVLLHQKHRRALAAEICPMDGPVSMRLQSKPE